MSEDKINEEQHAATQTVAKALDDAIGDNDPVEHETAIPRARSRWRASRPPSHSNVLENRQTRNKESFGPHHVRSYWTPERNARRRAMKIPRANT